MLFRSRSEEHTSELQSLTNLVCRLLLEKKRLLNWSAVSQIFLNVTLKSPLANFILNESSETYNSSYIHTCNVTCREDSTSNCNDVVISAQYYDGAWKAIETTTTKL